MSKQKNEHIKLRSFVRESICNIIQEKDNRRKIIRKIKMPDYVADWAHEISSKHSIWIADDFKYKFLLDIIPDEIIRNAAIKQLEAGKINGGLHKLIRRAMENYEQDYTYIVEWLQGRSQPPVVENDKINFKELDFDSAMRRAESWHNEVEQSQTQELEIEDEDGEVIITFPDGFYWINLGNSYCSKEGSVMGHCGRGEGKLYSLRKEGIPYVTADVLSNGVIRQMRGKANTKPKSIYHPYILEFLKSDFISHFKYWGYKVHKNFWLKDLGKEKARELIQQKPSLSKNQKINETLEEMIDEIVSTEVSNDGQGGIDSQTTSDTMGYYHSESGPLHQGEQPGDKSAHIYFGDSKGGNEQASQQSKAAAESGAKEQVEDGTE